MISWTQERRSRVPRPKTGETPIRHVRVDDNLWMQVGQVASRDGRTVTAVVVDALRQHVAHQFTFAKWPDVEPWLDKQPAGIFDALDAEISEAVGWSDSEYLGVAAWLAATRHPGDREQQQRMLTGFLLGRALDVAKGGWRDRYRDSRQLGEAIREVLDRHLPLV
jgi:hypothetical protein